MLACTQNHVIKDRSKINSWTWTIYQKIHCISLTITGTAHHKICLVEDALFLSYQIIYNRELYSNIVVIGHDHVGKRLFKYS